VEVTDHPVKVPPELFTEWLSEALLQHDAKPGTIAAMIADKAAQWGAGQELEACREWLGDIAYRQSLHINGSHLSAARRPKPPTLAEQGMEALRSTTFEKQCHYDVMFAALKRLAELEPNQ
jgi:hypothetical protein